MDQIKKVKYKSAGIYIDPITKKLLFAVGEEIDRVDGKRWLLSPGGGRKLINSQLEDGLLCLYREMEEELSLKPDDYIVENDFKPYSNVIAEAASDKKTELNMDCYMITLKKDAKIRPNYIEGDSDHDVYLAVWIGANDLYLDKSSLKERYKLKSNIELDAIDKDGKEIILNSNDFKITDISESGVIPELIRRKVFQN